jgi:hypothetical protein
MRNRASKFASSVAVAFLAFAGTAAWAETRLSLSTGTDYSVGEYGGTEETEVIAVPFAVRLTMDDWTFRLSASYLDVTGPADISEDGDSGSSGAVVRDGSDAGWGDTTFSVERAFRRIGGTSAYTEVSARVRLPTGDETKGLGVGATDYAISTEVGVSTSDGGAYLSAGYRFLGDRDDGPERQDGMQASIGAWLPVGNRFRVGAFGNWREASIEEGEDPANAGAYVSYRASERLRVTLTASGGLSDASPDHMVGIRFNWLPGALND